MSQHPRVLIQLDSDPHASVFDAVVAVDSEVDHLLQYASVEPTNARQLIHGAMFTRGPDQLHNTAIFIGGSNVGIGEAIAEEAKQAFFGPIRTSVMLDGNGSNTTAAAAVLCAARHIDLSQVRALVLAGTGPVGKRVARLLIGAGASVALSSRDPQRSAKVCGQLAQRFDKSAAERLQAVGLVDDATLADKNVVISCGAAGIRLLDENTLSNATSLKVAIDLNAVPPAGIVGIGATDKAVSRQGRIDYGAIGTGGLKMKIHRAAIRALFSRNDLFLDAEQIFEIGRGLEAK